MSTYHVYLRKGPVVVVTASGYTEDKRAKRFYFKTAEKKKKNSTFFRIDDVAGIQAFETPMEARADDWLRRFKKMPKSVKSQDLNDPAKEAKR